MMYTKFINESNDKELWELDYSFGQDFLNQLFPDKYTRKYSLEGEGIFNLLSIDDKTYDLKLKESKTMPENDGLLAPRDEGKNFIVQTIVNAFKEQNIKVTTANGKYIYFILNNKIYKIEVVKKKNLC